MALPADTRLGPYEVLGLIGAGGMGEVYKAKDTRLDRTVALKVLPPPESTRMAMRLTVTLPPDMPLAPAGLVSPAHDRPALALSPDGSRLAYVALVGGKTQICVRDMQTGTVTPLEHTTGGHTPFFSPDGAWIGFFADNKVEEDPIERRRGGRPRRRAQRMGRKLGIRRRSLFQSI